MRRAGVRPAKGAANKDYKNLNVKLRVLEAFPRLYQIAEEYTKSMGLRKRLSLDETIERMIMTYPLAERAARKPAASVRAVRNGKSRTA